MALDRKSSNPVAPAAEAGKPRSAVIKQLFDEHNRTLIGFLRARLRSEAEARDVAQEAYVRLLELESLNAVGFLRSYLFRVAANLAVDRLRHRTVREDPALYRWTGGSRADAGASSFRCACQTRQPHP
jgi:RNA polymerase sigma-70 factor (ECF subfamily)